MRSTAKTVFLFIGLTIIATACQEEKTPPAFTPMETASLIPQPVETTQGQGYFEIDEETQILVEGEDPEMKKAVDFLEGMIAKASGFTLQEPSGNSNAMENIIVLKLDDPTGSASAEAYTLDINEKRIQVSSAGPAGIYYGIQTLRQLLPASIEKDSTSSTRLGIGAGVIKDEPRFAYRGSMLDVSRHFFSKEDVKRYIDLITPYKLNHLHLHLSDDQGWRIEIKSWPELTTKGGSTEVGGGDGGYYTQEDYKEIVQYAAAHFITVVPEIDMPGHTNAALASYPELNCDDKAPELYTGIEVGFSSFCVGKPITYKFIDDVVREISAITPGKYFHAGGDESHATQKDDYIKFVDSVQKIVSRHDKVMIGWDEIQFATLDSTTVAQFWASAENANGAVSKGHKLLISPASKMYMDMKYDSLTPLGLKWAGYIEIDDAYNWDPATYVKGITDKDILGVEAPLWAETLETIDQVEQMVFPRILAYAEIAWSPSTSKDWESFKARVKNNYPRLENMGIDFYKSPKL
ncbi:MAG: beta-N-acetylhexosaminidase [Cytophagaceae bacterium]|nr:beta-N-acetylhexosaminidase [Cytophagaceae bacterium]